MALNAAMNECKWIETGSAIERQYYWMHLRKYDHPVKSFYERGQFWYSGGFMYPREVLAICHIPIPPLPTSDTQL